MPVLQLTKAGLISTSIQGILYGKVSNWSIWCIMTTEMLNSEGFCLFMYIITFWTFRRKVNSRYPKHILWWVTVVLLSLTTAVSCRYHSIILSLTGSINLSNIGDGCEHCSHMSRLPWSWTSPGCSVFWWCFATHFRYQERPFQCSDSPFRWRSCMFALLYLADLLTGLT